MSSAYRLLGAAFALALALPLHGWASAASAEPVIVAGADCPTNGALGGLPIHAVSVKTPLAFLPWIRSDVAKAEALAAPLVGTAYSAEAIDAIHHEISQLPFARLDLEARIGARLVAVDVVCRPQGLALAFIVFSTQVLPSTAITWEASQDEVAAPERQSGQEALRRGTRLQARLGYRTDEGIGGGVSALYRRSGAGPDAYWHSLAADAYASDALHDVSLALEGSRDQSGGTWARTAWRLGYTDVSMPAAAVSGRDQRSLQAGLMVQSRPLGAWGLPLRVGAELGSGEVGTGRSTDQRYQSFKLMAGTTTRLARHSLAASYAAEFGANAGVAGIDWVKQFVDLAHEGRWPVGDHRSLSFETRLTIGSLREPGHAPVGMRFLASGREQRFTGGPEWQIRAGPLLRGLGADGVGNHPGDAGHRRFAALNLTASLPVFNMPLVPAELYRNPQVMPLLDSQLDSAVAALAADMRPDLPAYQHAIQELSRVPATLTALGAAVAAARPVQGAADADLIAACHSQLAQAQADVATTLQASGITQVGFFAELLPGEGSADTLGQVLTRCSDPSGSSPAPFAQQAATLRASITRMADWFAAADPAVAEQAARREIEPVRHIVHTLINETNAVAVSPLLMLDVATLSPDATARPRIGLGGGLRVTLVDSADLSLGYMANLRRAPGETRGAFFLAVAFKDPF